MFALYIYIGIWMFVAEVTYFAIELRIDPYFEGDKFPKG